MPDKLTDAEVVQRLKETRKHGSVTAAAQANGWNAASTREIVRRATQDGLTADTSTRDPLAKAKADVADLKRQISSLQHAADTAEAIRKEIYSLASHTPEPPAWLTAARKAGSHRGVPTTIWSDWHYGEVVKSDEVGGVNNFNAAIAKKRIELLVQSTVEIALEHMGRSDEKYPGIVVMLGGDMISGDIHDELRDTNDRTPHQCVNDLVDYIAAALTEVANKFGKVFVPCVVGNHGRGTMKPRNKSRVYCTDVSTPTLTNDLRWVPAGSLKEGDGLLAFDEDIGNKQGCKYRRGRVTFAENKFSDTIAVTLENGTTVYVTPDHPFLGRSQRRTGSVRWITAGEMLSWYEDSRENKGEWSIDQFMPTWEEDTSYEAGYLAAAFDGEGCLSRAYGTLQLSFNQTENDMLEHVKNYLDKLGFGWSDCIDDSGAEAGHKIRHAIYIRGGLTETARFLGTVRPKRLLAKWAEFDISTAYLYKRGTLKIISVAPGGVREIASLSTSTKTYMSAGLASHNTSFEWNIYCQLERHFKMVKDNRVQFMIPNETDAYFKIFGHRYLLTHGDSLGVKGGDGIIGSVGPIMRGSLKVGRSEAQINRDFDTIVMGHWHQTLWLPGIHVNGTLKGYDEYARITLRAPYSRPAQSLWFTHPDHGVTAKWEVFLEKKKGFADNKKWLEVLG